MITGPQTIRAIPCCIFRGLGLFGRTAKSLMEATMFTTMRFPGSMRDI
jgi:hypothetical protein